MPLDGEAMTSESPQLQTALLGYRRESVRQILAARESMFRFAQERAQTAEARVMELEAELKVAQSNLTTMSESAEAAESREREIRAQFDEATEALQTQISRGAAADATLNELESELEVARGAARQHADAVRELASVRRELVSSRAELAGKTEQARSAEARALQLQEDLGAARSELATRAEVPESAPRPAAQDLSQMLDAAERGVSGIMERARHAYEDQVAQAERQREAIHADIERFGEWQGNIEPLVRSVQQGIDTARARIIEIPQQITHAVDAMTEAMKSLSDSLDRLAAIPGPRSTGQSLTTVMPPDTAEAVIQLKDSDPSGSVTFMPPSTVSRGEEEAHDSAGHPDPGDEGARGELGHMSP